MTQATPRRGQRLGPRLKKRRDFDALFQQGRRWRGRFVHVVVWVRPEGDPLRHAVVVSKRVDKRAVGRNRVKRRLREAWRRRPFALRGPADIAILAQPGSLEADYQALAQELWGLLEKAGLKAAA